MKLFSTAFPIFLLLSGAWIASAIDYPGTNSPTYTVAKTESGKFLNVVRYPGETSTLYIVFGQGEELPVHAEFRFDDDLTKDQCLKLAKRAELALVEHGFPKFRKHSERCRKPFKDIFEFR